MEEKLAIYAHTIEGKKSAFDYYRLEVPMRGLIDLDLANAFKNEEKTPIDLAYQCTLGSDISVFHYMCHAGSLNLFETVRDMRPNKSNGTVIYPPVIVYDLDDNIDFIHPYNPAYVTYGVRDYPKGDLLSPGDYIETILESGERVKAWEDGVTRKGIDIWDIARNLHTLKKVHDLCRAAHGVTVASPKHASYMRDVIKQPNVHVFPNTIIPGDYDDFQLAPHDGVRILWQGGHSHLIDWYPLREAVKEVVDKYPNVTWVIFGQEFEWINSVIPKEKREHYPWVDYAAYKLKRGLLRADINLCPLADTPFNWCKSAIKWYEASVSAINPEATLAANVSPYKDEIVDGETGLLYSTPKEFVQKLSQLIENAELRKKLGHAAHKWVMENRTIEQTIPPLLEFYKELRLIRTHQWLVEQGASSSEIKRLARQQGLR
jgi:glycosyltransferase involved in cell wall biosynthesis